MNIIDIDNKKMAALTEYAREIGKTRQTIYNWIHNKKLKSKKIGSQTFIILN